MTSENNPIELDIFKDENITKEQLDEKTQLREYFDAPAIGISTDRLQAFVQAKKWDINDKAHTASVRNETRKAQLKLDTAITRTNAILNDHTDTESHPKAVFDQQEATITFTREILELGLDDFSYDAEADNPKIGAITLQLLAQDVALFLVAGGQSDAVRHSQMQSRSVQLSNSIISTASQKNIKSMDKHKATSPE